MQLSFKLDRRRKQLQAKHTFRLSFIFINVVTFTGALSSCAVKLPSSVLSFYPKGLPLLFAVGQVCQ